MVNIQSSLMKSLCCVALNSKLRSILLFDISINNLQQVAGILVSLLKVTTESEIVVPLKLGTFESEDDLNDAWEDVEDEIAKKQRLRDEEHRSQAGGEEARRRANEATIDGTRENEGEDVFETASDREAVG